MFDLFIPYAIGLALGITPPGSGAMTDDVMETADVAVVAADVAVREPEAQVPTGKYTTAVEIRAIVSMTKGNWVAVREFNGNDLLYFTHLMSWRCGLWDIRYGVNGAPADQVVALEPCHEDTASPNAMTDIDNFSPYVTLPLSSVDTVYVEITYDDGTTEFAQFNRNEILIP